MKLVLPLLFLFIYSFGSRAQIITTVAGSGDTTFGDGGPAINASFIGPSGVALDSKGNFYVSDSYHNRIRKINTAGIITTIAGTGVQGYNGDNIPATSAQIYRPVGITFDNNDILFFCDAFNNRVRRIDTFGIITTVAGNGLDVYNGDGISATSAAINTPHWVAFDTSGNMYITDYGNHRVRKVATSGTISTIAGTGIAGYSGDNALAVDAQVNSPYGIALDDSQNIYFVDEDENVVRKINGSGTITTFAGNSTAVSLGDGGPATACSLNRPFGIAIDKNNSVYITDGANYRVRKVTESIISTVAGTGTFGFSGDNGLATAADLSFPCGIAIDNFGGVIYLTDFFNARVRRLLWPAGVNMLTKYRPELNINPNPSKGEFSCTILSETKELFNVSITDVNGKVINEFILQPGTQYQIEVSQTPGVYFLSASNGHGAITKPIVIIK